jgi:hypothetical protein
LEFRGESAIISVVCSFFLILVYHSLIVERKAPKYVYGAGLSSMFFTIVFFNKNHSISEMNVAKFVAFSVVNLEFDR